MHEDIGMDGWNWTLFPFRVDPLTGATICKDCWNGTHGQWIATASKRRFKEGCKVAECGCYCYMAKSVTAHERGLKSARTRERHDRMREQLEDESNPLRAVNPAYRG